jgi:hypothetical protein
MRGLRRSRSWLRKRRRRRRSRSWQRMRRRSWMRKEQEGLSAPCSCWRRNRRSPVNNDKDQ